MRLSTFVAPLALQSNSLVNQQKPQTQVVVPFKGINTPASLHTPSNRVLLHQTSLRDSLQGQSLEHIQFKSNSVTDFPSKHQQAQLQFLADELETFAGWTKTPDGQGNDVMTGTIAWVNDRTSGKFETENGALSQPCNPILAQIADTFDIPYPAGSGYSELTLRLTTTPDQKIHCTAELVN